MASENRMKLSERLACFRDDRPSSETIDVFIKHAEELEAKLERVAELPEKWKSKDRYDHYDTSSESKTMTKCANELQAILEDKT